MWGHAPFSSSFEILGPLHVPLGHGHESGEGEDTGGDRKICNPMDYIWCKLGYCSPI